MATTNQNSNGTNNHNSNGTNTIVGKVLVKDSGLGIPDLLVVIQDSDDVPILLASSSDKGGKGHSPNESTVVRIGSVLTAADGSFSLNYDDTDIRAADREYKENNGNKDNKEYKDNTRPDLFIMVLAPEDSDQGGPPKVLYKSGASRQNAGRTESFLIRITAAKLKEAGIDVPENDGESADKQIVTYRNLEQAKIDLTKGVSDFNKVSVQRQLEEKEALRSKLVKKIATNIDVVSFGGEIAQPDDNIKDLVNVVATKGVNTANTRINNSQGVRINLYLTPEDRERLKPFFDNAVDGFATIPEIEIRDILFRENSSENPGTLLIHQNPIAKFCAEETFEVKCAKLHTGLPDGEDDHDGTGDNGGNPIPITGPNIDVLTEEDIPKLLARHVGSAPSPDSVLTPEFNDQRADKNTIEEAVDSFSLRKGPAEVPAFYDFNSLQIAFEHVWKILLDEEIIDRTQALDKKYLEKTGARLSDIFANTAGLLSNYQVFWLFPQEVPAEVAAQFDIDLQEWLELNSSHQAKLLDISRQIVAACDSKTHIKVGPFDIEVPISRVGSYQCEKKKQELREQGDRIIDAVRHDDYYTMHKTLRDLHDRINSAYEFTVFAADKSFHSVNFGLLNTYRQQWEPINYQAGKLVKTIPMAPKEERKYSLKVMRTLKQAQKQAIKNNSSLSNEQSSTSRAEEDIMEKAQNKTNFGLNAEGTYNIGISKGKSTTTFGVEALNESSGARKDFHEAVVKAAQEYKEERSVEVNTEETSSYEYDESGVIVNPNDELSVTYLFYELQRRYRVSEQLYRVLPVVLVAQEVPAPHEITEAWVISNDWIINRCLLDDSFRPTLQYLANKSVGEDFALRELRKNLRQQRNLVDTLRLELAIASNEADNRYKALENAIRRRIDEESDENTDGLFSDIGDFFGGGGPDPEAMKARELAAKDAHQYAVEKAEKAASAMRQEVNNLHTLTADYNNALQNHLDNETRCSRLLCHIRNNIFYYMQAIWAMEPPDQRFLRLHKVQVPQLELATVTNPDGGATVPDRQYLVAVEASDDIFESFREPGTEKHKAFMSGRLKPITEFRPLVEVADLDNLLGFKGNYMIFPLKEHNALTEFMAAPYVDSAFGAMDPDELSNISLEEYSKYVCCLHDHLPADEFEALKPELKKWLELLLADPLRNGDEIVIPTNSLFIEILPGTHPLLENFKLRHRELDVYKVQSEVRKAELENLRLAARLLDSKLEDPDIEKKIVIEGAATPNIDVDNP
jgi:hypothetical protein